MIEIRRITPLELKEFYGFRVQEIGDVFGAFDDGRCIGISGVMRDPAYYGTIFEEDGRVVGFLDVREDFKQSGAKAVRAIRTYLRHQQDTIHVQCDVATFPQAERLLRLLGFAPTEEVEINMKNYKSIQVWKWQR